MYIEQAAAKINLTLQITGKRSGDTHSLHELESLVVFAAISDRLQVIPESDSENNISLRIDGPYAVPLKKPQADMQDNLILQAAYALRDAAALSCGAALQLQKNLPIMAGLGGGSADAAAALRLLNRFWQLNWPIEKLMPIAVKLGSDVPVCLLNQPAWLSGCGEQVTALTAPQASISAVPACAILLVKPDIALATADVFAAFDKCHEGTKYYKHSPPPISEGFASLEALVQFIANRGNDLTAAAATLAPIIPDICQAIDHAGAHIASMSGSGATCFGIFATQQKADEAADLIAKQFPSVWQTVTHFNNSD